MSWRLDDILEALADGVRAHELRLAEEHAVHGLDALREVALHPVLANAIGSAGFSAFQEVLYPERERERPKDSERDRCDLVVGPVGSTGIADNVRLKRELARAEGTLFQPLAQTLVETDPGQIEPNDALWLEVKSIGQHSFVDGISGPNRTYASQFTPCIADVRKLSRAHAVDHAALALVLFAESNGVSEHDLAAFVHKCLDADLPIGGLRLAHVPIADRIGNRVCTVGLVDVRTSRER